MYINFYKLFIAVCMAVGFSGFISQAHGAGERCSKLHQGLAKIAPHKLEILNKDFALQEKRGSVSREEFRSLKNQHREWKSKKQQEIRQIQQSMNANYNSSTDLELTRKTQTKIGELTLAMMTRHSAKSNKLSKEYTIALIQAKTQEEKIKLQKKIQSHSRRSIKANQEFPLKAIMEICS